MRIHSQREAVVDWPHGDVRLPSIGPRIDTDQRLGTILMRQGVLTGNQVDHVVRAQAGSGERFGEVVVALGFADQATVEAALAAQFRFAVARTGATTLDPTLVVAHGGGDRASELIRNLRTRVAGALERNGASALIVASHTGRVGRRLIVANLAVAFAQAGTRTLLVDADMRAPALHRLFGDDNRAGLSTLLSGRPASAFAIDEIPGLSVLPAGPPPPNPTELLARLPDTLRIVREATRADLVLLNTPPFETHDDVYLAGAAASHVLVVVRRDVTRSDALAKAIPRFVAAGCTVIGSVINAA